jgi:hypothetical protein
MRSIGGSRVLRKAVVYSVIQAAGAVTPDPTGERHEIVGVGRTVEGPNVTADRVYRDHEHCRDAGDPGAITQVACDLELARREPCVGVVHRDASSRPGVRSEPI